MVATSWPLLVLLVCFCLYLQTVVSVSYSSLLRPGNSGPCLGLTLSFLSSHDGGSSASWWSCCLLQAPGDSALHRLWINTCKVTCSGAATAGPKATQRLEATSRVTPPTYPKTHRHPLV